MEQHMGDQGLHPKKAVDVIEFSHPVRQDGSPVLVVQSLKAVLPDDGAILAWTAENETLRIQKREDIATLNEIITAREDWLQVAHSQVSGIGPRSGPVWINLEYVKELSEDVGATGIYLVGRTVLFTFERPDTENLLQQARLRGWLQVEHTHDGLGPRSGIFWINFDYVDSLQTWGRQVQIQSKGQFFTLAQRSYCEAALKLAQEREIPISPSRTLP